LSPPFVPCLHGGFGVYSDIVTVSVNEMSELLDDHRNVELRKKQKRDYARKKRAFERSLREKFPVLEAEVAALQKQNEQLKMQLAFQSSQQPQPQPQQPAANVVPDAHSKLNSAVKQLAAMGFSLNGTFTMGSVSPTGHTKKKANGKKANGKRKDKMDASSGSSSPSSSSDDESVGPLSSPASRTPVATELNHAIGAIGQLLEETHVSAESQLSGLQNLMESAPLRAISMLAGQLTAPQAAANAEQQASEQALVAMRAAHQQLTLAMREYAGIAKRSFGQLASVLSPEQLARSFQAVPLQ